MRNKIIALMLIFFTIICAYCTKSEAAISAGSKSVNSEEQFQVTITSDIPLASYTIEVINHDGLEFVTSSGGSSGNGTKKVSNALAEGTLTNLVTFTFKAPKVTSNATYTIKFQATGMGDKNLSKVTDSSTSATITVKAPAQPPAQEEPKQETPKELEFTSVNNKKVYLTTDTNFRSACNTEKNSVIKTLKAGTELVQIGVSKTKAEGYIWSKVTYQGQTGYVVNNNLTTTKPAEEKPQVETPVQEEPKTEEPKQDEPTETNEDGPIDITNGLKSLEIAGLTLTPEFTPNVYEYRVIVEEDISTLDINAVALTEDAKISIAGNENLKEGENLITITVYNSKNEVATYQITTFKNTADLTKTDEILKAGNKAATRGLIIFVAILAVSVIGLIVVLVLKRRNEYEEYDEEDEDYDFGAYPDTPMPQNTNQYINQEINDNIDDSTNQNIYDDTNENLDYTNNMEQPIQRSVMQEDFMQDDFMQENVANQGTEENDILEGDIFEEEDKPKREKRKGKHF